MEKKGFAEFSRHYPTQCEREAIIIDLRGNCGGYCSAIILDTLSRKALGGQFPRYGKPTPFPPNVPGTRQIVVALINEDTSSDGEGLAYALMELKIAKTVGTRTWGGMIVTGASAELVDGTSIGFPTEGFYLKGHVWGLENKGITPDVLVPFPPVVNGTKALDHLGDHVTIRANDDPQLKRAVNEAMKLISAREKKAPVSYHQIKSGSGGSSTPSGLLRERSFADIVEIGVSALDS